MGFADDLEIDRATNRVRNREGVRREFKRSYEQAAVIRYAKTLAAFANADGGCLIFGVTDAPRTIIGCDVALLPDEATLSNELQRLFEPAIRFEMEEREVGGFTLAAICVEPAAIKPVICKKTVTRQRPPKKPGDKPTDETVLCEGDIYYRYAGKSERIRFAELVAIFAARDQRIFKALAENLAAMQKIGVDRVGIVDVTAAGGHGDISRMYVSREAAKALKLIDKGRFVESENEGDRAYFVVGTVEIRLADPVPVDDEDRLLPEEATKTLLPDAKTHLAPSVSISPIHLANLARALGFRNGEAVGQHNTRYCKHDPKSKRWFYREAFVTCVCSRMRDYPLATAMDMKLKKAALQAIQTRLGTIEQAEPPPSPVSIA